MRDQLVSTGLPPAQGLYDPQLEHDACGIGFVANVKGQKSHDIIVKGIQVLVNLTHRGACGCDPETGDGAGVLIQIPHKYFARECAKLGFTLPAAGDDAPVMTAWSGKDCCGTVGMESIDSRSEVPSSYWLRPCSSAAVMKSVITSS